MPLPQERIYTTDDIYALPDGQRAELVDGHIYYMAPPSRTHQRIIIEVSTIINNYILSKKGTCSIFHAPFDVKLSDNPLIIVQPDIMVVCDKDKLDEKLRCERILDCSTYNNGVRPSV